MSGTIAHFMVLDDDGRVVSSMFIDEFDGTYTFENVVFRIRRSDETPDEFRHRAMQEAFGSG